MAKFYKNCGTFANLFSANEEQIANSLIKSSDDPLWEIEQLIDFEALRPVIEQKLNEAKGKRLEYQPSGLKSPRNGRPGVDPCCVQDSFRAEQFNLSDHALVAQIKDRVTFRRFLNIHFDLVPSASTIWKYRELFSKSGVQEMISKMLIQAFEATPVAREGDCRIIDSSFTEVRIQRNTPEENKATRPGKARSSGLSTCEETPEGH